MTVGELKSHFSAKTLQCLNLGKDMRRQFIDIIKTFSKIKTTVMSVINRLQMPKVVDDDVN